MLPLMGRRKLLCFATFEPFSCRCGLRSTDQDAP